MPPPNTTPGTAIDITTFPFEVDVDPEAGGISLYYKVTGPASNCIIGAYANSVVPWIAGHYLPSLLIYEDDGTTPMFGGHLDSFNSLQIPVATGELIYIRIRNIVGTYTTGDTIHLSVVLPPNSSLENGDILINDDTNFFPLLILRDNGEIVKFIPFPAGERASILRNRISLWQDRIDAGFNPTGTGSFGDTLSLFDSSLVKITDITGANANTDVGEPIIVSNHIDTFYVVQNQTTSIINVRTIDTAGAIGATTWTLPTNAVRCKAACPNRDETILYYASGNSNTPVRRYDLVNSIELSTFLPGQGANYEIQKDILVLADDTVVIAFYLNNGATQTFKIVHYETDGTIKRQWDYDGNDGMDSEVVNRMEYNKNDDSSSFWVWFYIPADPADTTWEFGNVQSRFVELSTTSGAVIQSFTIQNYEVGIQNNDEQFWDGERFGPSTSCPLIVYPATDVIQPGAGIYKIVPNKRNDTLYVDETETIDVKIPDPTFKTGYFGS